MTCDISPYYVEYGYFMFLLDIVDPDKLTLEEPDDQDQQCFLHYGCE